MRFQLPVLAIAAGLGVGVHASAEPVHLLLSNARVLDESGAQWLDGVEVLIVDGRIAKIGPSIKTPGNTTRIDLAGLSLVPGLIDLHTHLLLHPYDEASWNSQVLNESLELRTIRAVVAARRTVEAGFTTIRDLGTEGAAFADVALRDAVEQGIIEGPRIFASTRAIVATGCYGPTGFDPRWDVPKGAQVADGVDGVRKAVRQQIAAGADWIKFYADYRRQPSGPTTPTFSVSELRAIVEEARSAGLPVAAHATIDEAIRGAVRAGVDTIEHGYEASVEVLDLMHEHRVVLCPTLAASEAMAIYDGWKPGMPEHSRITGTKEMFERALRSGVTIACGSDAGVFSHGDNVRELELMVDYGMPPARALRAATATAAEVVGRGDDLGKLAEGAVADLVAVCGDPLKRISVLREPIVVIKYGVVLVNRRVQVGE